MARANDLTPEALEGFDAGMKGLNRVKDCPHLATSACWYAWQAGYYMAWRGMPAPSDVRMGRGHKIRVRDMIFTVDASAAGVRIDRVQ